MTRGRGLGMVAPACIVIMLLFGGALVGAVRTSLQPGVAGLLGEVGLDAWRSVLRDPGFRDALWFSARITVAATVIAALLSVVLAAGFVGAQDTLARSLIELPVAVPHLLVAVAAVFWIGPGGVVDRAVGALPVELIRDRAGLGIVVVYVFKEAPFLTLLVAAAWGPEVRRREEVAAALGASPTQRLRWIVWPAIAPALGIGCLIVAAFVFGSFEVPLVVGPTYPKTLAVLALDATRTAELAGHARAASILLITSAVSVLFTGIVVRQARRIGV